MNNLVFSNMMHRPMRTFVSIFGIGIGVLLIVFTTGLANGSLRERAQREANVGAEILFRPSGAMGLTGSDSLSLNVDLAAEIKRIDGIENAIPIAQNTASAKDASTGSRLIDGVNFDEYAKMSGLKVIEGRKFIDGEDEVMADSGWLPQRKLKVGDSIDLYDRKFKLVGTYDPGAGGRIKISLATLQKQLGAENRASAFLIKVKEGVTAETAAANINKKFPDNQIIFTKDLEELYLQSIPALNIFLNVVIGVAGVVSALIILLTMYTIVTERTRQIGILKSLGMSTRGIIWIVVQEALLMSVGGVVSGVLMTILLKFVLTRTTTLNVQIEFGIIMVILTMGVISGLIGALYPALRAARLDAVEALSYE